MEFSIMGASDEAHFWFQIRRGLITDNLYHAATCQVLGSRLGWMISITGKMVVRSEQGKT